jgi:hypothetical protein
VGTGAFARPAKRSEASRDHDSRGFMPNFAESFAAKATGTSALPIQIYLATAATQPARTCANIGWQFPPEGSHSLRSPETREYVDK